MPDQFPGESLLRFWAEFGKQATAFTLLSIIGVMAASAFFAHMDHWEMQCNKLHEGLQRNELLLQKIEKNQDEVLRLLRK